MSSGIAFAHCNIEGNCVEIVRNHYNLVPYPGKVENLQIPVWDPQNGCEPANKSNSREFQGSRAHKNVISRFRQLTFLGSKFPWSKISEHNCAVDSEHIFFQLPIYKSRHDHAMQTHPIALPLIICPSKVAGFIHSTQGLRQKDY